MTESRHTPGDWVAIYYDETAAETPHWAVDANLPDVVSVATVHAGYGNAGEAEANAYLIAAAPGLLAACEKLLAAARCGYDPAVALSEYGALAEAAIAKARGG